MLVSRLLHINAVRLTEKERSAFNEKLAVGVFIAASSQEAGITHIDIYPGRVLL